MGALQKIERKLRGHGNQVFSHLVQVSVLTFTDYQRRGVASLAASVSFYAIFSVFPVLAFLVYLVGKLIGVEQSEKTAPIILKILKDYVPAMQGWIEKGVFDVITGTAATSWLNAILLGWSGLGLFSALLSAIERLPEKVKESDRSSFTQILLAICTLGIFSVMVTSVVLTELASQSSKVPFWVLWLPFVLQDVFVFLSQTGVIIGLASVLGVALLFKLLIPCKVSVESSLIGAGLFSLIVMVSRSAYWLYMHHYNEHAIESSYGAFSALVLIMLWMHFMVSCLLYSGLFALHLDQNPRKPVVKSTARAA